MIMKRLIIAFSALSLVASAQPPEGPKPPPKPGEPPRRGPGDPGGPGKYNGGPGGSGKMRSPPPGFEKLSEEDKKLLREAFEKNWNDPDVLAARDEALKANEKVRRVLHDKMSRQDPRIAAILEKMRPPYPMDERGLPQLPPPESPDFARAATARLGAETMSVARPGRHEETRRFHDRIMQFPRIRESISQLEAAQPGERIERFRKLKELYRQLAGEEWQRQRQEREAATEKKQ